MRFLRVLYNSIFRREEWQTAITAFHFGRDKWEVELESAAVPLIAKELGDFFIKQGAVNYVALDMIDKENMIPLTIIIQRQDKLSMQAVNTRLREALKEIANVSYSRSAYEAAIDMSSIAIETLREVGYGDKPTS